jgi:hypothetical protein
VSGPLLTQLGHEAPHKRNRRGLANATTVIGCRATLPNTTETYAPPQQSSIGQCRQADDHQVFREVACADNVLPNAVLFRLATQPGFSKTFSGLENKAKHCLSSLRNCRRKTCFTSIMERNNAWPRRLVGRLLLARVICVTYSRTLATVSFTEVATRRYVGSWPECEVRVSREMVRL